MSSGEEDGTEEEGDSEGEIEADSEGEKEGESLEETKEEPKVHELTTLSLWTTTVSKLILFSTYLLSGDLLGARDMQRARGN